MPNSNKSEEHVKIAAIAAIVLILVLVAVVTIADRDPDVLLRWATSTLVPLLPLIFVYRQAQQVEKKTDEQTETLNKIEHQTNGKLDARLDKMKTDIIDEIKGENGHE